MKLVLTLLVRDEADVVDAQIAFHLNAGVDFVVATDHTSQDGTTEILERYAQAGYLHLIREAGDGFRQSEWVTRMARLAATDFGADWVINSDADEFWWPRAGDLKEILALTSPRFGILRAPIRHFFLRVSDGFFFPERMIVRPLLSAPVNEPENPLRPNTHILHRGDPGAVVTSGNHALVGSSLVPLDGWYPVEVLHFPLRSLEQCRRKYANWIDVRGGKEYPDAFEAHARGMLEEFIREKVLDDDVLERGLAEGSLVLDTRLRDALRVLAGDEAAPISTAGARFALPGRDSPRLSFPRPSVVEDAAYAVEAAVLGEADAVRLQRRLDQLDGRLASLERTLWRRVRARTFGSAS